MRNPFSPPKDNTSDTVFRDVMFLVVAVVLAMLVILLKHVNPPEEQQVEHAPPPGQVIVEAVWPEDSDTDVDMWVQAPGDLPVGYSNKGGLYFNLLRDDLGNYMDATGMNYEVAYSRGIPDGEYTVNLHMYRNIPKVWPIDVKVVVSAKKDINKGSKQILASEVQLKWTGQEMTVFRFKMKDGKLVSGSVHGVFKPLRGGVK